MRDKAKEFAREMVVLCRDMKADHKNINSTQGIRSCVLFLNAAVILLSNTPYSSTRRTFWSAKV